MCTCSDGKKSALSLSYIDVYPIKQSTLLSKSIRRKVFSQTVSADVAPSCVQALSQKPPTIPLQPHKVTSL